MAPGDQFTHHVHHSLQTSALPMPMFQLETIFSREQLAEHIRPLINGNRLKKCWSNSLHPLLDRHDTLGLMLPRRLRSWDVGRQGRAWLPFEIQEKVLVRITSAAHQDDIALKSQAACPCDPPCHIAYLKKGWISLGSRKALHEFFHLGAVLVVDGQGPLAIQAQASLPPLTFRTAIKKVSTATLPQPLQQVFDHPTGSGTLNPSRLAVYQRGGVSLKKDGA